MLDDSENITFELFYSIKKMNFINVEIKKTEYIILYMAKAFLLNMYFMTTLHREL